MWLVQNVVEWIITVHAQGRYSILLLCRYDSVKFLTFYSLSNDEKLFWEEGYNDKIEMNEYAVFQKYP